ncbi:MAG: dethiobiotin synthase [Pelagibacterales bacterium]|nr:dethiobiotin synthase [Pelagibacterales bacterium]
MSIEAFKPILSGFNKKNISDNDSSRLLIAANKKPTLENISYITPWLFKKPLAPSVAAKYEKKYISYKALQKWCLKTKKNSFYNYLLFEGAGGLMVPIEKRKTFIDLFKDLKFPIILVAGNYLGTISHTLSAIENLKNNNIEIINIVFNEGNYNKINYNENINLLKNSLKDKIQVRRFSKSKKLHENQVSKIANDIIRYFKKMA